MAGTAGCFLLLGGKFALERLGLTEGLFAAGFCAACILAVILAYVLLRILASSKGLRKGCQGMPRRIAEGIIVIVLLACGIAFRIYGQQYITEGSAYYEAAKVSAESGVPEISHGAVYFYIQLLHIFMLLFGNKYLVGIWLQLGLQLIGSLLWYAGIRKMAGSVPAVLVLGFLMISPSGLTIGRTYSPVAFYLCLYGLGILLAACCLEGFAAGKRMKTLAGLLTFGLCAAFLSYLDISGIALLFLAVSILTVQRNEEGTKAGKRWLLLLIFLSAAVLFFAGFLVLDAILTGSQAAGVWKAWLGLYTAKGFGFVVPDDAVFVLLFIVGGMILCGIGYWNQCRSDRLTPWILILTALGILEIFQLPAKEMSALDLILCVGVTLAGLGIQNCLSGAKAPDEEEKKDEKTASEENPKENPEEKAGLRFIENPLPLPKKHVKKTMDYAFEPDEAMMKYDVEVADGDDYDI